MLKSSLCDYSDAYIRVTGDTKIAGYENDTAAQRAAKRNAQVTLKVCCHSLKASVK